MQPRLRHHLFLVGAGPERWQHRRVVSDSGGHKEERIIIETRLVIGGLEWPIEATLTARDDMLFRMLIGRTAINGRATVNPARSYLVGKKPTTTT